MSVAAPASTVISLTFVPSTYTANFLGVCRLVPTTMNPAKAKAELIV
jgi:hypothetical protein